MERITTRRTVLKASLAAWGLSVVGGAGSSPARAEQPGRKPARSRSIRIAHLTDTHVQPELEAAAGLAACFGHAASQPDRPELIVTGGDLIMDSFAAPQERTTLQWELWTKIVRDHCPVPIEHCLGNHDIWGWNKQKSKTTGDEARWGKKWACDVLGLEKPYRSFDRAGWHFVVLDSVFPEGNGYLGKLDDEQFDWLKNDLAAVPAGTPVAVVSHIPVLAACVLIRDSNIEKNRWSISGGEMMLDGGKLHRLFAESGKVKLCLSGHIHMLDDVRIDGVRYICDGAVSGAWWKGKKDRCDEGYGIIDLYDDGSAEHEYVKYGWQAQK